MFLRMLFVINLSFHISTEIKRNSFLIQDKILDVPDKREPVIIGYAYKIEILNALKDFILLSAIYNPLLKSYIL